MSTVNQTYKIKLSLKTAKYEIPKENMVSVVFKESVNDIIPRVIVTLNDKGHMSENVPILDGDVLEMTFAPNTEADTLTLAFVVSEFRITPKQEGTTSTITITGLLDMNKSMIPFRARTLKGTSKDVFKTLASEAGIKFDSSMGGSPSDNMFWYQYGNALGFVNHILKRSYVPDDISFFYVGQDNVARYASLKKAWSAKKKFIAQYSIEDTQKLVLTQDENDIMYFMAFDVVSANGTIKRDVGYGERYISYNGEGEAEKNNYVDSTRNANIKNVSKDYSGKYSKFRRFGWVGSNPNVYKDYHKAIVQNEIIQANLYENTLSLRINAATEVMLLDKVVVKFPSFTDSGHNMNDVWSGEYLVVGVAHSMSYGGAYEKRVLLARRGMNISADRKVYNVE